MIIDEKNTKHIIAENGLVFHRKGSDPDVDIFGTEMYLGYSYYINGKKLDTPHLDMPDDFEEIPEPVYPDESPATDSSL